MAKKFDLGYYCSEGVHSIFTHGFMSFAAVCMIVACLLIMGSFSLVAVNLDNMLGDLEAENIFLAYVDETYTEEQSRALQSEIEAVPNVSDVTFVTKGEAMEDYKAGRENNPLVADLPDEVLRDRFEIHVKDIEQMEAAVEQVKLIPEEQYEKLSEQVEAALQKKLLSLIQQGKDIVIDFSFWSKENRNFYKELIQKAGAETELVYMKASKELLQKRLYKRNQVLNANSPFVITDEILEHHYHAFQEPCGEGEKVILQKEDKSAI